MRVKCSARPKCQYDVEFFFKTFLFSTMQKFGSMLKVNTQFRSGNLDSFQVEMHGTVQNVFRHHIFCRGIGLAKAMLPCC